MDYVKRLLVDSNIKSANYRAEIVESLLRSFAEKGKMSEILDVGCGLGQVLYRLRASGYNSLSAADCIKDVVFNLEQDGFKTFYIDLNQECAGLSEKKYDVILSLEVLEHLYDPARTLKMLKEHLTDDGLLILSVPNEYRLYKRLSIFFGREIGSPEVVGGHIKFFHFDRFAQFVSRQGYEVLDHFGAGGFTIKKYPFGRVLFKAFPSLLAKWTFVVARPQN